MIYNSSYYEDEFLDNDEPTFAKLSQKTKVAKQDKKAAIKAKRKEKMRRQEESGNKGIFIVG